MRWGELNDFQPKANCEDPGMPILIVKIPRPRTPHPICWWIQWRSQWGTHRGTITSTIFVWFICVFHIRYVSSTSGSLMSLLRFDNFSCQCFSLHLKWLCWHNSWVETCSHKTCAICLSSGEAKALVCSRCRQEMGAVGVVGATVPPILLQPLSPPPPPTPPPALMKIRLRGRWRPNCSPQLYTVVWHYLGPANAVNVVITSGPLGPSRAFWVHSSTRHNTSFTSCQCCQCHHF